MSDYDSYGSDFEDSGGILDGRNTTTSRYSGQVQTAVPENVAVPPPQTRTLYSAESERKSHDLSLRRNDGSRNSSRIPLRRSRDSSRAENGYKGTSNTNSNVLATAGLASFDRADSKSAQQRNGKPPVDRNTESSEETIQKLRLANSALRRQVQQLSTALEEAQVRHTTTSRLSDNGSHATESPAMERKRFLQELGSKDKQIRMLTKKLDNLRRSLKAKKEQLDVTLAGDRVVQLENQKRDLERQLGALADENKALVNMQRQLIKRVDEEEQLHGELPHKIQSLSEDVRVLKDKLRTAKANESQAQAQFDKQRARMMKIIDVNRQYKQKLRNVRSKLSKQRNLSKLGSPLISGLSTPASSPPNSARFSQARTVSQNVFDNAQDAWDKEKRQLQKQLKDLKARLGAAQATSPSAKHLGTNTSSGQAKSSPSGKHQRSPAKATSDASRGQKQAQAPVDTMEHTATSQDTSNYMQTPEVSGSNNNDARDSKYSPLQTGKRTATPTSVDKASHAESKDAENVSNDKNTLNVSPKPPAAQGGLAGLDYSNIMDSGAASDADDDDDEYGDEDDFEDTKNSNEESMLAALNGKQPAPEPTFPTTNNTNTSSTGMQNAQTDINNGTKPNTFRFGQSGTSSDPYDYKPSFLAGDGGNTGTDNKNYGMNDPMKQNINSHGNGMGMNTGNTGMNTGNMGMNTGGMGMNTGGMGMNNNSNGMGMNNTGGMGMNTGGMGMNTGGMGGMNTGGMNNNISGRGMGMNTGMNTGGMGMNGNQNNFGSSNMNSNDNSSQPSWLSSKPTVGGPSTNPVSSMNTMGTNNQSKISTTGMDDTPSWLRNETSTTGLGSNTNVGGIGGNTQINGIGNFSSVGGGNIGVSGMTNPPGTFNTGNTFGNNMTSNGGNAFSKPTFGSSALGGGKTNYDSLFS